MGTETSSFISSLVDEIAVKSEAAADYYTRVRGRISDLQVDLNAYSKNIGRMGEEFRSLTCSEKKPDPGIAYHSVSLTSHAGKGTVQANVGEPGLFRVSISYSDSGRPPKDFSLYFPTDSAPNPEHLAEFIVRSIVIPNPDNFPA